MLESLAAWVLKHYLGKYVENLNTDQLSIGLLQGQVELENLPLKKEALRQVGLPIQIKAGFIGKIKLQIPFRQIRSAPWVIIIEKLYLVAGPVDLDEWDEETEEQALQEQKMHALEALEAQWRANADSQEQSYYASSYSSWMNFGTSVITNIVENLQSFLSFLFGLLIGERFYNEVDFFKLNISDVHFRYEDKLTIRGSCFSSGLTIESLVAQNCNDKWEPGFASGEIGFKIVELLKFAIYWDDCTPKELLADKETTEFMNNMHNPEYRGHYFLLDHVSGVAHIKRNRSTEPLRSKSTPRIICDILFDEFPITLSDRQYSQMILWMKGLSVINTRIQNRHLRPQVSAQECPFDWWKYSYEAVLRRIKPNRYSWDIALERTRDNVAYVDVFQKLLQNPNVALSAEERLIKERVEFKQSFEELRILREVAMRRTKPIVKAEPPKIVMGNKKNFISAWFPQWWYTTSLQYSNAEEGRALEGEILDVFNNPNDATYLKRDVVFGHFNFSLKEGSVQLRATVNEGKATIFKPLMDLQVEKVLLGFEYRPRSSSYRTTIALGSINLKDLLTKETAFPSLVSPQGKGGPPSTFKGRNVSKLLSHAVVLNPKSSDETLFQLSYEYKPFNSSVDYRIHLRTQSLDIVYNPEAVKWISEFFSKPLQQSNDTSIRSAARQKYQEIKTATKNELIKNWEQILAGDLSNRKTWDIDLDISAPQIIFVEHFCDKNAVMVIVDFGRLHLTNGGNSITGNKRDSDDEEAFQTPCSTPPGSEASPVGSEHLGLKTSSISELSLHEKLYDRYTIELSEMQVLIGEVRDNWKYAHLKGTSVLHVLDRFNISMQVERRLVYTTDPQFPSLTFSGTLPRLVVHISEKKIFALRAMLSMITDQGHSSPFRSPDVSSTDLDNDLKNQAAVDEDVVNEPLKEMSKLIIMQFTVQQLALEVQSRNRSIAELQVSGVRAACNIRPFDTSVTLSVHSLLLVDALQNFGRDFELLVASHKHVGMDSVSGSMRDSEPTSPVSPASPEPTENPASPVAISQALNTLQNRSSSGYFIPIPVIGKKYFRVISPVQTQNNFFSSPPPQAASPSGVLTDSEALIMIELTFVSGSCPGHDGQPLQIAAIQFNNLDIIANQETIVELLGFARRVFPPTSSTSVRPTPVDKEVRQMKGGSSERPSVGDDDLLTPCPVPTKIEATFDFHRLNVLLLRAVAKDGVVIGRKICTTTVMQAKIKATVGEDLIVEGSLGGIQVVDLTPEGQKHQRILSLGADPLASDTLLDLSAGLYTYGTPNVNTEKTAFSFSVKRSLRKNFDDCVNVKVRLASVWYTHSPLLVRELQSCATEFKQYLSNLAKSIKSAATEMAIGFVHARAESLAQSLSMSGRLSASLYGSTSEVNSPKKRRKSFTQSVETLGNTPHTPYSPCDDGFFDPIDIHLDVVLDTPVIILPMSPTSDQVFVAHLGKITARNSYCDGDDAWGSRIEKYFIEIRDMNLYSLTAITQGVTDLINSTGETILPRPDKIYPSCDGKPILHNTVIEIVTERVTSTSRWRSWDFDLDSEWEPQYRIQVSGRVIGPLKVSLSREQYKQLLESVENLISNSSLPPEPGEQAHVKRLDDIQEEGSESITGVSMLSLDPALRARMLNSNPIGLTARQRSPTEKPVLLRVMFGLPEFTIELSCDLGKSMEGGLVSISFRDFLLNYDQTNSYVSYLQMSLKSLVMEDLLVPVDSKNRFLVVSSAAPEPRTPRSAVSQSCPDLSAIPIFIPSHQSLPDRLCAQQVYPPPTGRKSTARTKPIGVSKDDSECPCTPPPSPRKRKSPVTPLNREENLVLINVTMVDKEAPNYSSEYNGMDRLVTVDFNCLDVIANIKSWVVVFDFFGMDKSEVKKNESLVAENSYDAGILEEPAVQQKSDLNSKLDLEVRSLTLVLIRPEYEVARANISYLTINTKTSGSQYNWEGKLGSMSLTDLTPQGKLYRERFLTTGNQALHVNYIRYGNGRTENRLVGSCDSELRLEMSSVVYIHTQRFLGEINAYFLRFSQLQAFVAALRSTDKENEKLKPSSRMLIEINAGSPVLLLPLSSSSPQLLVADLGKLTVRNKFRTAGSEGATLSTPPEGTATVNCLLDIMSVDLVNMDLFAGRRCNNLILDDTNTDAVDFGIVKIIKEGPSLLPDKCHLKLQIDRNLDTHLSREVPDLSVKGTLKKLEASLDLSQYKLIRGLLTYNIGENMQDLYEVNENNDSLGLYLRKSTNGEPFWLVNSIHLDLVNVVVHLRQKHGEDVSLACINFIKSRLVVETFSDCSQDIDLVSAEILIADTRFQDEPSDKRWNLYTNILQPMGNKSDSRHSKDKICSLVDPDVGTHEKGKQECDEGSVQAEVHYRRRKDYSKATVLLNNMRLMAVLDWWEIIRDFILTNATPMPEGTANDILIQNLNPSFKQTNYISGPVGVVTKCPPIVGSEVIPFEFKLNITDSEIVLLEDTSVADSNAIILKSTTVISYRPEMLEKPLSCNLNHCEVFSCVLGMEEETALSIIDPVTVNMEVTLRPNISEARGLSDAMITSADRTLEVQMQHLCVRLSYHDFRMLSQMLESIHRQTYSARKKANEQESHSSKVEKQTLKLCGLGFSEEDCAKALEICSGQIDDAALWLTQNAKHVPSEVDDSSSSNSPVSFQTVEVKLSCLSICVIDDCRDADVPLLELSLSQLYLKQEINGPGLAKFLFTSDYYNRVLSGWEPFIEPWRCSVNWKRSLTSAISKNWLEVVVTSEELLNINITSTLIELYSMVKDNWTQDYYSPHRIGHGNEDNQKSSVMPGLRRRSPFVPFALKNDTNSVLWFTVLINTTETISEPVGQEQDESWIKVNPNETVPFTFGGRKKVRHRDTHKVRVHQIAVRVDNWAPAAPVSVDKVGVYFRHAEPMPGAKVALPRARLVFAITLEGSARKLVTVRSALTIKNCLTEAVEAKLENPISYPDVWLPVMCLQIPSNSTISVPLSHALAQIWIRPLNSLNLNRYHAFSSVPLAWNKVENSGEVLQKIHRCPSNRDRSYRFVASIRRENFPNSTIGDWPQPAHTITLISPLEIINLLPCDLYYSIKEGIVHGYIKPGLSASIHEVDCDYKFKVHLHIENFPKYGTLLVPSPVSPFSCRIKLHDESGRRLDLNVFVQVNKGAALRISVSAPYWIINRTSFPLVFRQEGTSIDTAGQFEENEIARVVTPLLFSLSDPDASPTVQARVGAVHQHQEKNFQWCQHFHLQGGVQVRRLRVSQRDHRQDIVYLIGIHIRPGKGRYRHTNIVTLSPRFQLHNKSSYQLQFSQKCLVNSLNDPGAQAIYATAVKDCSLAWHWPKLDEDLFLCVRLLDVKNCFWSGGFRIDNEDSFHINVRDRQSKMYFLRVEVVLRNATYFVVFTNADNMPPPVMINNFSHVPIQFYQSSSNAENFHSTVRPQTSVAYAWDQPVEPPRLTLVAPGGATAEYDINASTDVPIKLTYENFIYIAFTATFNHVDGNGSETNFDPLDVESQQLVLDCVDEYRVILNRKQPGARSQLWRMTTEGRLEHEGSSPPRDPHSKSAYHNDKVLVLDIAGTAPQPTQCVALVLKRPNERRLSTQTWKFTEDGRLCCSHKNMCVQAKDGFFGLRQGSEAVLGPGYELVPNAYNKGVPIEQAVSRMKMRPGSGLLSVSISSDGPTRVMKIVDPKDTKTNGSSSLVHEKYWSLLPSQRSTVLSESVNSDDGELKLKVDLKRGFGISIVSRKPPEELLYLNVRGFFMNIDRSASEHKFDCTIEDIQCDNQLFEPQYPVLLYVTRGLREDDLKKKKSAISISAHKLTTGNSNFHNYKHFEVRVNTLSLCIEERLLLKLYAMFGNNADTETEDAEESDFETQRMIMEATSVHATRYYFQKLNIVPSTVRLSFVSSAKLPPHLLALKRKLGLTLIKFEDAAVGLKPFIKIHPFETSQFLINSILKHFKEKLKWQAPFILGSVDFLGNPVGFFNDVTEGVSGLLHEGSVAALLKSITHGFSNSAAKVTESLSDSLGWVILDDTHEETRQRIRKLQSGSSSEHIVAGLKGLGFGLLGGLTSLFKQTYEGAASDGVQGLISGFGKGLVGTVTKPAIGVLDFATETASAVRDSSRSSIHQAPPRFRLPRCVSGPGGLLPLYSAKQSQGQEFLYMINERNYSELLLTYEILSDSQDLRILITSDNIRVITSTVLAHVLEVPLADLYHVEPLSNKDEKTGHMSHYIVLTRREELCTITGQDATKQPKVLCDSRDIAVNVSKHIKYAKALFEERSKTLISSQEVLDELYKEYI